MMSYDGEKETPLFCSAHSLMAVEETCTPANSENNHDYFVFFWNIQIFESLFHFQNASAVQSHANRRCTSEDESHLQECRHQ